MLKLSKPNDSFFKKEQALYYQAKMIAAENLKVMLMQIQDNPYRQAVFDEAKYIIYLPQDFIPLCPFNLF